jgi:hypothetical protein
MPGTSPRIAETLQRRASAPLLSTKPQQPIEHGLFGDQHNQGELFK